MSSTSTDKIISISTPVENTSIIDTNTNIPTESKTVESSADNAWIESESSTTPITKEVQQQSADYLISTETDEISILNTNNLIDGKTPEIAEIPELSKAEATEDTTNKIDHLPEDDTTASKQTTPELTSSQ